MYYILSASGHPMRCDDSVRWARWMDEAGTAGRTLVRNELPGDVQVSTVFLGVDHAFGNEPPILWETMIFGGPLDGTQDRYTTRDGALAGHAYWLEEARKS